MSKTNEALEDFSDNDLIGELDNRGYSVYCEVSEALEDCSDYSLLDEVEARGYLRPIVDPEPQWDIYSLFELKRMNDPMFEKAFADYVYQEIGRIL